MRQPRSGEPSSRKKNKKIAKAMPTLTKRELRTRIRKRVLQQSCRSGTPIDATLQTQKVSSFADNLNEEEFECPICMELFIHPFRLPCGHIFCYLCIDNISRSLQMSKNCPCCRSEMGDDYPMKATQVYLMLGFLLPKLESSEREKYMSRLRQVQRVFGKRNKSVMDIGLYQRIGYKVGNIWRLGILTEFLREDNQDKIEVMSFNRCNLFIFNSTSCHLESAKDLTNNLDLGQSLYLGQFSYLNLPNQDPQQTRRVDYSKNEHAQPDRMFLSHLSSQVTQMGAPPCESQIHI